jgi:hypothetical protein
MKKVFGIIDTTEYGVGKPVDNEAQNLMLFLFVSRFK